MQRSRTDTVIRRNTYFDTIFLVRGKRERYALQSASFARLAWSLYLLDHATTYCTSTAFQSPHYQSILLEAPA